MVKTIAALALVAVAGCASLASVDAEVSSYSRWPAGRAPSSYAFERLPSQQAHPEQARQIEDAARRAIEAAGFVPVAEGAVADVVVQLGARVTAIDPSPFDDPFWVGRLGPFHRPFVYGPYGRPYFGPAWRYGGWYPGDYPYVEREVAVLIRDKRSGDPLYEARADSDATSSAALELLPALFDAALKDFPKGGAANPHRVRIPAAANRAQAAAASAPS